MGIVSRQKSLNTLSTDRCYGLQLGPRLKISLAVLWVKEK